MGTNSRFRVPSVLDIRVPALCCVFKKPGLNPKEQINNETMWQGPAEVYKAGAGEKDLKNGIRI